MGSIKNTPKKMAIVHAKNAMQTAVFEYAKSEVHHSAYIEKKEEWEKITDGKFRLGGPQYPREIAVDQCPHAQASLRLARKLAPVKFQGILEVYYSSGKALTDFEECFQPKDKASKYSGKDGFIWDFRRYILNLGN